MRTVTNKVVKRSKLALFLGALFVLAGAMKLIGLPMMVERFADWGYTADFRLLVGAVELLAGVGLMFPRTARYASMALMPVMIGAAYTHVFRGTWMLAAIVPLLLLGLLMVVAARPYRAARVVHRERPARSPWGGRRRVYSS